jgi:hypothetical protein
MIACCWRLSQPARISTSSYQGWSMTFMVHSGRLWEMAIGLRFSGGCQSAQRGWRPEMLAAVGGADLCFGGVF